MSLTNIPSVCVCVLIRVGGGGTLFGVILLIVFFFLSFFFFVCFLDIYM